MTAYHIWDAIAAMPDLSDESGVRMMPSDFFFPDKIENDDAQHSKMLEIMASGVRGFYRGSDIIKERRVNPSYGAVDAYELLAPVIDTDKAMEWLTRLVQSKGAQLVTGTIKKDLLDVEDTLRKRFVADVIVNCTGLCGQVLAGDTTVYPIRGGLIRVINDGSDFPKVEAALTITADAVHDSNEIVFLVPRNDSILLIGGIAEPHEWELNLTLDSPIIRRMRERCEAFLPSLKSARVDVDYPLAQGLRPFRGNNVRVERELRKASSCIVHSYGQGGAGWSLSFGCAQDVTMLVEETLAGIPPRSMKEMENERKALRFRSPVEIRASL